MYMYMYMCVYIYIYISWADPIPRLPGCAGTHLPRRRRRGEGCTRLNQLTNSLTYVSISFHP